MKISRKVLKKAAKKLAGVKKKPSVRYSVDMATAMKELEQYTKKREEVRTIPRVVDFAQISVEAAKKKEIKAMTKELKETVDALKKVAEPLLEETEMKGMPLKAHKIPTQYLKTMKAEWKPPELTTVDKVYPLIEPYAIANLKWNEELGRLEYFMLEPALTKEQKKKLETIKELIIDVLDVNVFEVKETESIRQLLKEKVDKLINDYGIRMTKHEYSKILYYMNRDFIGMGIIEPLMQDPNIEDISCDGIDIPLYIYHRRYASMPSNLRFPNEEVLNRFVTRIAQRCGKHISVAEPLLDAALPDGSRVQATFSSHKDISMHGSTFTIRKFTKDPLTITDMLNFGTLPALISAYLWLTLEYRNSILVAGGTATGKTSLLNALVMFVPEEAKIVSIEDTPEIKLPHEHWVQKVTRTGFGRAGLSGKKMGEITMYDLLRAALRERPDNIIVGEVRGKEAFVLFQGMATGHCGLATIHGDSVASVMNRLRTPPINLSPGLLQHLNTILVLTRARVKGVEVRRAKEVVEIIGITRKNEPVVNTLFKWNPADDTFAFASDRSYALEKIMADKGISESSVWEELHRRARVLRWMKTRDVRYYKDVGKVLQTYYKNPEKILKQL